MANIIQIKRSSSTTSAPSLAQGELAYSEESATQTLYYGTIGGSTIVIGGKKFIDKIDHTAGTLTASSALIADSNSKIDVLKSGNILLLVLLKVLLSVPLVIFYFLIMQLLP